MFQNKDKVSVLLRHSLHFTKQSPTRFYTRDQTQGGLESDGVAWCDGVYMKELSRDKI